MSAFHPAYRIRLVDLLADFRADQEYDSLQGISDTPWIQLWHENRETIDAFSDEQLIAESAFMSAYKAFNKGETK